MAVYTEVGDDEFMSFMAAYDVGDVLSLKGIAEGIENTNYAVLTAKSPFILTLFEKRVDAADLPFFLGLMDHLSNRDIPCPIPLATAAGERLRQLAGRPAALFSFLPGLSVRKITPDHCQALGVALAKLHMASSDFSGVSRENDLSVTSWRGVLDAAGSDVEAIKPGLRTELLVELEALEAAWPDDLPETIIHADLFPDNVFFKDGKITGLIDFYFACRDIAAYDLAVCMNAWCFERDLSFNVTKARRLLRGYQTVRGLEENEIAALPILCRGAAMRFLVTRLHDWIHTPTDALVVRKDPMEYLARLTFHQGVGSAAGYGLAI